MVDAEDDQCPVMIHVEVHRAYFNAHADPETYVELQEDQKCGYFVKVMSATRPVAAASAWESEVVKSMCEIDMHPG